MNRDIREEINEEEAIDIEVNEILKKENVSFIILEIIY